MFMREWGEHLVGPYELLNRDARIVTIFSAILSNVEMPFATSKSVPWLAEDVFASLMLLAQEGKEPIKILINSPGGSVSAGFIIIDAIEHLQKQKIEVWTIAQGGSYSMATAVLAAGTIGKRYAFHRSVIHAHPTTSHVEGRSEDVMRILEFQEKVVLDDLFTLFALRTKIPEYHVIKEGLEYSPDRIAKDMDLRKKLVSYFTSKETYLRPSEGKDAGIIDHILEAGDPLTDEIFRLSNKDGGGKK